MMYPPTTWVRCTKASPCPVCSKTDWCGLASDGTAACCMRVESSKPAKNGGWIHRLTEPIPQARIVTRPKETIHLDAETVMDGFRAQTDPAMIETHAAELGVSTDSLDRLCAAYAEPHKAFAWPMRDPAGRIVGIRLRDHNARKWAVRGSRAGLFCDPCLEPSSRDRVLYVTEGPTDTAAAITLGLPVAGRHACRGQTDSVGALAKRLGFKRIVVIADHDEPGQLGALDLVAGLGLPWKIITPIAKDLRAWVATIGDPGATRQLIECIEQQQIWRSSMDFAQQVQHA